MKARKRTKRLRLLIVCILVSFFLGSLAAGVKVWLYPDVNISLKKSNNLPLEEKAETVQEEDKEQENLPIPESSVVKRKNIYDRNLKELALSFLLASVYVKPLEIRKEEGAIKKLSELLDLNEKELSLSVSSERSFVWLERNIDREMVDKIRKLAISGVYIVQEGVRFYPKGKLASHIIGFSKGMQGLAGVESYYDNVLTGNINSKAVNMVAAGVPPEEYLGKNGSSLILTLDLAIQEYLEQKLAAVLSQHDARSGMAMIMHSKTGEILALTNYPTYDSNVFWKYDSFERRNRIVTDPVKPGAFLQVVRMAAEMEEGNVPEYILEKEDIALKIIEPKIVKKVVSNTLKKQVNPVWKMLKKGVYWPVLDKPFRFVLSKKELQEFSAAYGLSEESVLDLPINGLPANGSGGQQQVDLTNLNASTTGLKTLIAFNQLLSRGKRVRPHVLKEIWHEEEDKYVPASFEQRLIDEGQGANRNIIRLIHELSAVPQKNVVLFETLVEEKDDAHEQGLEFAKVEDPLEQEEQDEKDKEGGDHQQTRRGQGLILGAIPSSSPELTMIMVVDGMMVDLGESSLLRPIAGKILKKGLALYLSATHEKNPELRLQEKDLYEKWSRLQINGDNRHISRASQEQEMPSVLNLSLRKALQVLQNYNLQIRIEGNGRVVAQHPAPGKMLKEMNECVLQLKVDN